MNSLNPVSIQKPSSLLRNISYLVTSEATIRVTRLVTAVILARMLTAHEFGVIAIAMTVQEVVQTLTRNGIGAKIVQTSQSNLKAVCNTVYRLNWQICLALFFIQSVMAQPLANFYQDQAIFALVLVMAIPYLIYPWSMVQVYLIQRDNRLNVTALANGTQVSIDNLCCAGLALSGFGIWSVIIPKLIVAPLWVFYYRNIQHWRPDNKPYSNVKKQILSFSGNVLGTEILATSRRHIDRLLIGYFLGLDILGIYYFAVNAGLGLTLSLSSAFNTAFYPHLCALKNDKNKLSSEFKKGLLFIIGISILVFGGQALLAPWYVPIVFGEQWQNAIPVLIILTLSGIFRPAAEACAQMLRAINKPGIDFKWNLLFTCCIGLSIYFSLLYNDIEIVAYAILFTHTLLIPIYLMACWFFSTRFSKPESSKLNKSVSASPSHLLLTAYPYLKDLAVAKPEPELIILIKQLETYKLQHNHNRGALNEHS
jgi:PST family polysaccharide transporter